MLNIAVFCGGTGSTAIQEGFSELFGNDYYNIDFIINAYDNGKSTGICRSVFKNKILGPSDLRKNQLTQFRLIHKSALLDYMSRESILYRLFSLRISAKNGKDYFEEARRILEDSRQFLGDRDTDYLLELLDYFFFESLTPAVWRKTIKDDYFCSFSLANIFYSSAAMKNGGSMRQAAKDMSELLQIKDNVHLISDLNLFLQAKTRSGFTIIDEGQLVDWDNALDRIESVCLLKEGTEYIPKVDECTDVRKHRSVREILLSADMIVLSSGTQWSSLVPTYLHSGLRETLELSKAKKYLIINNSQDKDMKGFSADDIVETVGKYINVDDFIAVVNQRADPMLNKVSLIKSISGDIGAEGSKHNPIRLVQMLMKDYYGLTPTSKYVFDLDGTLWDERSDSRGKAVGSENMNLFSGIILSGNSFEHVKEVFTFLYHKDDVVDIFSDFGNVHFNSADFSTKVIAHEFIIDGEIVSKLEKCPEFFGKIVVRGEGNVITIKPLFNREKHMLTIMKILEEYNGKYKAFISGHTSIDIMNSDYGKKTMLKKIIEFMRLDVSQLVFVGNEVEDGSESNICELGVKTIQVNDIYECNLLLKTINSL